MLGFRVWGLGFGVLCLGFRVSGLGFLVWGIRQPRIRKVCISCAVSGFCSKSQSSGTQSAVCTFIGSGRARALFQVSLVRFRVCKQRCQDHAGSAGTTR